MSTTPVLSMQDLQANLLAEARANLAKTMSPKQPNNVFARNTNNKYTNSAAKQQQGQGNANSNHMEIDENTNANANANGNGVMIGKNINQNSRPSTRIPVNTNGNVQKLTNLNKGNTSTPATTALNAKLQQMNLSSANPPTSTQTRTALPSSSTQHTHHVPQTQTKQGFRYIVPPSQVKSPQDSQHAPPAHSNTINAHGQEVHPPPPPVGAAGHNTGPPYNPWMWDPAYAQWMAWTQMQANAGQWPVAYPPYYSPAYQAPVQQRDTITSNPPMYRESAQSGTSRIQATAAQGAEPVLLSSSPSEPPVPDASQTKIQSRVASNPLAKSISSVETTPPVDQESATPTNPVIQTTEALPSTAIEDVGNPLLAVPGRSGFDQWLRNANRTAGSSHAEGPWQPATELKKMSNDITSSSKAIINPLANPSTSAITRQMTTATTPEVTERSTSTTAIEEPFQPSVSQKSVPPAPAQVQLPTKTPSRPPRSLPLPPPSVHSHMPISPFWNLGQQCLQRKIPPYNNPAIHQADFQMFVPHSAYDPLIAKGMRLYLFCLSEAEKTFMWPPRSSFAMNGTIIEGKRAGKKKIKNTALPIDITNLLKPGVQNTFTISKGGPHGAMELNLWGVYNISDEMLLDRILNNQHSPDKVLSSWIAQNNETDILMTSEILKFTDIVSMMPIKYPFRAKQCSHYQCFDGLTFLSQMRRCPTWECPVCNNVLKLDDLVLDGLFEHFIVNAPTGACSITLHPSGEYQYDTDKDMKLRTYGAAPKESEKLPMALKSPTPEAAPIEAPQIEAVDLTLSSDDEELPLQKPVGIDPQSCKASVPVSRSLPMQPKTSNVTKRPRDTSQESRDGGVSKHAGKSAFPLPPLMISRPVNESQEDRRRLSPETPRNNRNTATESAPGSDSLLHYVDSTQRHVCDRLGREAGPHFSSSDYRVQSHMTVTGAEQAPLYRPESVSLSQSPHTPAQMTTSQLNRLADDVARYSRPEYGMLSHFANSAPQRQDKEASELHQGSREANRNPGKSFSASPSPAHVASTTPTIPPSPMPPQHNIGNKVRDHKHTSGGGRTFSTRLDHRHVVVDVPPVSFRTATASDLYDVEIQKRFGGGRVKRPHASPSNQESQGERWKRQSLGPSAPAPRIDLLKPTPQPATKFIPLGATPSPAPARLVMYPTHTVNSVMHRQLQATKEKTNTFNVHVPATVHITPEYSMR